MARVARKRLWILTAFISVYFFSIFFILHFIEDSEVIMKSIRRKNLAHLNGKVNSDTRHEDNLTLKPLTTRITESNPAGDDSEQDRLLPNADQHTKEHSADMSNKIAPFMDLVTTHRSIPDQFTVLADQQAKLSNGNLTQDMIQIEDNVSAQRHQVPARISNLTVQPSKELFFHLSQTLKPLIEEKTAEQHQVPAQISFISNEQPKEHTINALHSLIEIEGENKNASFGSINDLERIDWNDYELMAREVLKKGPGEQGAGYTKSLNAEEQRLVDKLKEKYKYNAFISDQISLERSLKDTRTDVCKKKLFLKNLPENSVSFVVIFNDEKNSTLLRTVHGIVNRSPKKLLREIVLVDDRSTSEELMAPLEDYIAKHFEKVRLIRNKERQGLIRSRMIGANQTSGSFLIFLDAHVEVNVNFLPPLLEPIVLDYRTIVCPMVDNTVDDTLEVRGLIYRERGAFDWSLIYKRLPVEQEDESEPHPVTSMIGCAIAISRRWWEEIGKFDPGLEIWGGEQFEISFKSWMCGGKVVDAPCSRVAHLFRSLPYVKTLIDNITDQKNLLRVASVWMDEYKEYFLQRRPHLRKIDPGDLTSQFELRKRLKCKSFDWFMKVVAPDILTFYPVVEPQNWASGKIRSNHNSSLCFQLQTQSINLAPCTATYNQFYYGWRAQIREAYEKCMTHPWNEWVYVYVCYVIHQNPTQTFLWDRVSGRIVNPPTKRCMDYDVKTLEVVMKPCNLSSPTQSWQFESFNITMVDQFWEEKTELFNFTLQ